MNRILIAAVLAISTMVTIHTALAQSVNLGGTMWTATSDDCLLDINFNSDGTAAVHRFAEGDDTAHWTLNGNAVHLTFDTWYGGIEGTISNTQQIEATVQWTDKSTQTVHNDPCLFEKD
jgi:hypothetical protein